MFSCEIFENFKKTYFEEHLLTTAPECPRKISPLLVLEKPMVGGRQRNRATNTLYCKYEPHEVSQYSRYTKMLFLTSFRPPKSAKITKILITILKCFVPATVVEQF